MEQSSRVKPMDPCICQQTGFHTQVGQLYWISEFSLCFRQVSVSKRISLKKGGECMTKPYKGEEKVNVNTVEQWHNGLIFQRIAVTVGELQQIYSYVDRKTQGFTRFPPEILCEEPRSLRIFLATLHMSYKEFAGRATIPLSKIQYFCWGFQRPNSKIAAKLLQTIEALFRRNNLIGNVTFPFVLDAFTTVTSRRNRSSRRWPPVKQMTATQFQEMLRVVKQWKGFKVFPPILLIRHPQTLFVYRVALDAPRHILAKIIGVHMAHIEDRENGEQPIRFYRTAERIMDALMDLFNQLGLTDRLDETRLVANFEHVRKAVWQTSEEMRLNAQKSTLALQCSPLSLNPLELEVIGALEKNGVKCYFPNEPKPTGPSCMIHGPLWDRDRTRSVDFAIPDNINPAAIVECRTLNLPRDEPFAREIDHIFYWMRQLYPNTKFVFILKGKSNLILKAPNYIAFTDEVFTDENFHQFPMFVKSLLADTPNLP
jgi:hypothetical protein